MGCNRSRPIGGEVDDSMHSRTSGRKKKKDGYFQFQPTYEQTINSKCPVIRLDTIIRPRTIPIDGKQLTYDIQYCYVSQRGYYPNSLNKPNQDSYTICESMLGDKNCLLFGIFGTYIIDDLI